jgi:hypothetical protein
VTKFTMSLRGGKRGLLANAEDVCAAAPASVRMIGQNNRGIVLRPRLLNPRCAKHKTSGERHGKGRG